MKILIVEDEPRAAAQLLKTLQDCQIEYDLLDVIDSVEEAVQWFAQNKHPDLLFLDIQLADGLSFEIFQKVDVHSPIIFTTAFDQYAIKAFKVNSIDYLLKPVKVADLQAAIDKYHNTYNTRTDTSQMATIMEMLSSSQNRKREGILVKDGSGYIQIKVSDINYLYSSDSITFAIVDGKRYIVDEPLDQFMTTVDQDQFYRINRSQAVNKYAVSRLEPYLNHRLKLQVLYAGDREFVVSRQRSSEFKRWLNQ